MKKIQLIKRITNQSHNLQVMAINSLKEFLEYERNQDNLKKLDYEWQQKEKDRILRKIMDSNLRLAGIVYRQAYQYMESEREKEIIILFKQRGIMRRMLDSNMRLMSAGYNKLMEEAKERKKYMQNKLRNIIKSLTDKDTAYMIAAYNGLKQRA